MTPGGCLRTRLGIEASGLPAQWRAHTVPNGSTESRPKPQGVEPFGKTDALTSLSITHQAGCGTPGASPCVRPQRGQVPVDDAARGIQQGASLLSFPRLLAST